VQKNHRKAIGRGILSSPTRGARHPVSTPFPAEGELKATGSRIADIKDHEFKTWRTTLTHARGVEPLPNDYEIEESGCLAEISGLGKQFQYPAQGLEICNDI